MDPIILEAVCGELQRQLMGQPVDAVVQIDPYRFLLRFGEPPFPRLHVVLQPGLSAIHATASIKVRATPTELGVAFTTPLHGRRLLEVERPALERRALLRFEEGRTIVVELMGKSSNMLLLDPEGRIETFARSHRGEFRRPRQGDLYQPPPPSSRWIEATGSPLTPGILARALESTEAGGSMESRLVGALPGFSPALARELEFLMAGGRSIQAACEEIVTSLAAPRAPVLYTPAPPDVLDESQPLTGRSCFPFVMPLAHAAALVATPAGSVNEAQEQACLLRLRRLRFEATQSGLSGQLRAEARRVEELGEALAGDLRRAESAAGSRRHAELLLAQLATAQKAGPVARIVDYYDPAGGTLDIPIDPRLGLKENAARMFAAARRAERTLELVPGRLASLQTRRERVAAALRQAGAARDTASLESIESDMQKEGIIKAVRRTGLAAAPGRKARYLPVSTYTTRDGFTVLVGRGSAENDELTFRVAAPDDLWLHAAGWPGAHVVVRNPRRLRALPDTTVREAAAIAAWHSKGRGEPELDVHVSFRKHVRKGRGMSPGMVTLRKHRTVRVAPALPARHGDSPGHR